MRDCDNPRKEEKERSEREMALKKWCYVLATLLSLPLSLKNLPYGLDMSQVIKIETSFKIFQLLSVHQRLVIARS